MVFKQRQATSSNSKSLLERFKQLPKHFRSAPRISNQFQAAMHRRSARGAASALTKRLRVGAHQTA
eukprot:13060981-Alexandrium_andersonii.AAC.1